MTAEFSTYIVAAIYSLVTASGIVYLSWINIKRRKSRESMRSNIEKKLQANVTLTAKDIIHIGRGLGLSPQDSRNAVFGLHAQVDDKATFSTLRALTSELEKEELFDELPDEVKPSLSRISRLIEQSVDSADKNVLLPLTTTLAKYVELKAEQEKAKQQTYRAYVITIISFVIGSVSFYYTLRSPTAADIKMEMQKVMADRQATGATPR